MGRNHVLSITEILAPLYDLRPQASLGIQKGETKCDRLYLFELNVVHVFPLVPGAVYSRRVHGLHSRGIAHRGTPHAPLKLPLYLHPFSHHLVDLHIGKFGCSIPGLHEESLEPFTHGLLTYHLDIMMPSVNGQRATPSWQ